MSLAAWLDAVAIAAYATLLLELTMFPIPSEASTWQLLAGRDGPSAAALQRVHANARSRRVLVLLLPTAIGVLAWLLPLLLIVVPGCRAALSVVLPDAVTIVGIAAIVLGRTITFARCCSCVRRNATSAFLAACSCARAIPASSACTSATSA